MESEAQPAVVEVNEVELPSFRAPVLYVHARIPPCDTLGHKAEVWNVAKPDFTCSLFCCTKGDTFIIRLLTENEETFAESFWKPGRPMASVIDAATDSSRYFALRVENPETGAHHFLGIGFAERDTAGQFKLTLSEHGRYIQRMKKAQSQVLQPAAADDSAASAPGTSHSTPQGGADSQRGPGQPQRDLSLKGSIKVSLPNQNEKRGLMAKLNQAVDKPVLQVAVGPKGGLLPPPPIRKTHAPAASANGDGKLESWVSFGADSGGHASEFNPFPDAASPALPGVSGDLEGASNNDSDFGDFCGAD